MPFEIKTKLQIRLHKNVLGNFLVTYVDSITINVKIMAFLLKKIKKRI